jgi:hypothetical protein
MGEGLSEYRIYEKGGKLPCRFKRPHLLTASVILSNKKKTTAHIFSKGKMGRVSSESFELKDWFEGFLHR